MQRRLSKWLKYDNMTFTFRYNPEPEVGLALTFCAGQRPVQARFEHILAQEILLSIRQLGEYDWIVGLNFGRLRLFVLLRLLFFGFVCVHSILSNASRHNNLVNVVANVAPMKKSPSNKY